MSKSRSPRTPPAQKELYEFTLQWKAEQESGMLFEELRDKLIGAGIFPFSKVVSPWIDINKDGIGKKTIYKHIAYGWCSKHGMGTCKCLQVKR